MIRRGLFPLMTMEKPLKVSKEGRCVIDFYFKTCILAAVRTDESRAREDVRRASRGLLQRASRRWGPPRKTTAPELHNKCCTPATKSGLCGLPDPELRSTSTRLSFSASLPCVLHVQHVVHVESSDPVSSSEAPG